MKRIPHEAEAIVAQKANDYTEEHSRHLKIYQKIADNILKMNIPGEYLEVGAGPGLLATLLASKNPNINITAIDTSVDMKNISQELFRKKNLQEKIKYIVGNAADKNIFNINQKFDVIYSTFSLHHWEKPEIIFANLMNLLKEDGTLYIYDFKRIWWLYYLPETVSEVRAIKAGYLASELRNIFKNIKIKNYRIKSEFPVFLSVAINKN